MRHSETMIWASFLAIGLLGCAHTSPSHITISSKTHLDEIVVKKDYDLLKKEYTLVKKLNFGPDPTRAVLIRKVGSATSNYKIPERKIEFNAILWDLPLIKAYIKKQNFKPSSNVALELKEQLMSDHKKYVQVMLAVDSYVKNYFSWEDWSIWIQDRDGRSYLPEKTQESIDEEVVYPKDSEFSGPVARQLAHTIYHHNGTLYFKRIDLPGLSPLKLILVDKDQMRRIELKMKVSGKSPEFPEIVEVEEPEKEPMEVEEEPELEEEEPELDALTRMRMHFKEGSDLYREENYQAAINSWKKVLEIDSTHRLSRVKIKKAEEKLAQLEEETGEMVLTEPQQKKRMGIHFLLATELFKSGDYEGAITEWNEVLKIDPNHELSKQKIEKAKKRLKAGY